MIKTFILDAVNEIDAILGIKAFILNIVTKIDSFFGWGVLKSIYKATIEQNRWFLYIEGIINTLFDGYAPYKVRSRCVSQARSLPPRTEMQ